MVAQGEAERIELRALPGLPVAEPGADLAGMIVAGLASAAIQLQDHDLLAVTSKLVSRAEGRFVNLAEVEPSVAAAKLAEQVNKDPRLVELILRESSEISRAAPGVLITRHRLGFVSANAAIDASNVGRPDGQWVLLLPEQPDRSAATLCAELHRRTGAVVGVVITDSHGRPFREGAVGVAIGVAGLAPLTDQRGKQDLFGCPLVHSVTATADQVAAAAELVAGQAAEGRPVVHLRGLRVAAGEHSAQALCRPRAKDLYA